MSVSLSKDLLLVWMCWLRQL